MPASIVVKMVINHSIVQSRRRADSEEVVEAPEVAAVVGEAVVEVVVEAVAAGTEARNAVSTAVVTAASVLVKRPTKRSSSTTMTSDAKI
jgi:hypothetical protein